MDLNLYRKPVGRFATTAFRFLAALMAMRAARLEAQGNLVVNGDFSAGLNGWLVSSNGIGASWSPGVSVSANEANFYGGLLSSWTLSQLIATTAGSQYEVSFTLRGGSLASPGNIPPMTWSFGDYSTQLNFDELLVAAGGYWTLPPQDYDMNITATQPASLLRFTEAEDTVWNLQLANVSVNDVPEPSAGVLLGLATALLAAAKSKINHG